MNKYHILRMRRCRGDCHTSRLWKEYACVL